MKIEDKKVKDVHFSDKQEIPLKTFELRVQEFPLPVLNQEQTQTHSFPLLKYLKSNFLL